MATQKELARRSVTQANEIRAFNMKIQELTQNAANMSALPISHSITSEIRQANEMLQSLLDKLASNDC